MMQKQEERKSIVSIRATRAAADRIDLFAELEDGADAALRLICVDEHSYRLLLRTRREGFAACGAAQTLAAEIDGVQYGGRRCFEEGVPIDVAEDGGKIVVRPSGGGERTTRVVIDSDAATLSFVTADGRTATTIGPILQDETGMQASVLGSMSPDEHVYGTGERFDAIDRTGKSSEMWAIDRWCETEGNSYVPVPFFLSTAGYGLFLNRFEPSRFDLGEADPERFRIDIDSAPLDLYVFLHPSPAGILGAYADLTGHAPLPPEWAFGVHVCRHLRLGEFASTEGIREMMRRMDEHRLPYSSVIIEGWDTYDTSTYPELKEIVAELHGKGKKVLVYEPCGRFPNFWVEEKRERNEQQWEQAAGRPSYMVHDQRGGTILDEAMAHNPADAPRHRTSRFLDLTNPEALAWWTDSVWGRLVRDIGIDGAKIDFCEQVPEGAELVFHDGRGAEGMHHLYPVLYNTMMYDYYQANRPEGGMCLSRGGGIGAQRYPFMWCGDQLREWRFLGAIVKALVSSGLSGIPFMSHDLGGYMPTRDAANNVEKDVFVRGTQFAAFTGNMQTHGIVTRPYDFDEKTVGLYRAYSEIHYLLIPYLREQARTSCETGLPLMRHLYVEFPEDPAVVEIEDQYLLGADLLVAPVLDSGEERPVYLPDGQWRCLYSGTSLKGAQRVDAWAAPLSRIPVFVREERSSAALEEVLPQIAALVSEYRL